MRIIGAFCAAALLGLASLASPALAEHAGGHGGGHGGWSGRGGGVHMGGGGHGFGGGHFRGGGGFYHRGGIGRDGAFLGGAIAGGLLSAPLYLYYGYRYPYGYYQEPCYPQGRVWNPYYQRYVWSGGC